MKLLSARFKNFKNLKDVEIDFSSFLNLFEGQNGQGKSSILEAISYILTDTLNDKIVEYVRRGEEKFELYLELEHNAKHYDYTIIGSAKGTKKELVIDQSETYSNSEATKKFAEVVNPTITMYSAIAEQGKNVQLLFDTPANRLKRLKEILGIDKINQVVEEIKSDIKEAKSNSDSLLKEISLLEQNVFEPMEVPEIEDIEARKEELSKLEKEKELFDIKSKMFDEYLLLFSKWKENENKKIVVQSDIDKAKEELEKVSSIIFEENIEQLLDNKKEEELKTKELHIKHDNELSKYNDFVKTKQALEEEKVKYEKELEQIKVARLSKCEVTQEQIDIDVEEKNELEVKVKDWQRKLDLAEQGKCPTCGALHTLEHEEKRDIQKEVYALSLTVNTLSEKIKDNRKKLSDYETLKKQNDLNSDRRKIISDQIETITNKLEQLIEVVKPENTLPDLDSIKKEIQELQVKVKNKQEHEKNIQVIQNKIDSNSKVLEALSSIEKPVEVDKPDKFDSEKLDEVKRIINVHDEKVKEKERVIKFNEEQEVKAENNKKEIEIRKQNYNTIQKNISIWEDSKNVLDKDFSSYLIDKGAEFIKEQMNDFFQKCYNKYEISFSQDKNSIDFFYADEKGISPCSLASGWEKSVISISLRSALCSLQNLDFMILDEVDAEANVTNSMRLYKNLIDTLPNYQFFCISHKDETKEMLANTKGCKAFEVVDGKIN